MTDQPQEATVQDSHSSLEHQEPLPHPEEDPVLRYCHESKQYEVIHSSSIFEITHFNPDGPAGGIVVIDWVDKEGHPLHEHQRTDSGISKEVLQPFVEKHDAGVVTANLLLREIRELNIGEIDPWSYNDLYYEHSQNE